MTESIVIRVVPENKYRLLRDTYAKGATPQEFELFVSVCERLRLDPFARQIYAVKRWDTSLKREVMQAQVSIDGMRLTAERTGQYAGQASPEWCGHDGRWRDVWLSDEPPAAARVAVYRRDFTHPIVAVALFREYAQYKQGGDLTRFWAVMPSNQLAKCAEALALRKAFPNELSGVYTAEEMAQAESEPIRQPHPAAPPPSLPQPSAANDNAGPRFHSSWSHSDWAGRPLADAPREILAEYLEALDRVLDDGRRKKLWPELRRAKETAEAIYDRMVVAEMDAETPPPDADPIADGIQAEYDRAHAEDGNAEWGLE